MTIFSRYVFKQAAGAVLLILLSLSGVVWIAIALRQLNVVTSQGQNAWTLMAMTTLALPNLMAVIAPFALLIACLHTLSRLNGDSELIVMTAAGGTVWNVARPLIFLAVLVAIGLSYVNHVAQPWSLQKLREYLVQMRTDLLTQVIQPGRFNSPEEGLTFHIRERALNGELLGLLMNDVRDPKQSQTYLAENGIIVREGKTAYLIMTHGHITRRSGPTEPAQIIVFDKYAIDLARMETKAAEDNDLKPRERFYSQLVHPEPESLSFRNEPGKYRAELHERLSNPLYPFAFVLIALAAAGQAQSTRQNRTQRLVIGFALAAGCRLAGLAVSNLVAITPKAVPVLYGIPILISLISLVMMITASQPTAARWIGRTLGPMTDALKAPFVRLLTRTPRLAGP